MKKIVLALMVACLITSCSEPSANQMVLTGNIAGLKKGKLILQRIQDSVLVDVDSLHLRGSGTFTFNQELESPEVFYLSLIKADENDYNDHITFFGEPGTINVKTTWNAFDRNAVITGSKSNDKLQECLEVLTKFNTRSLELMQESLKPDFQNDPKIMDSLIALNDKNTLRRYLYVLNFALSNTDSYVAPYIALTEAADAQPKFLDSINSALSPEVASSKYGKELQAYLKTIKHTD
ncbi:MAG: DUF4369 domain-containing protein [Croceitalea sp.]|nr:DUF4369 domain-containing protein [Croceitalea sp.]MBT8237254.1 DUF4369 domain-containing protein [Croceitalea sp.]NNL08252.1 DUF4369 domain-containing protein [Croceitalea sp.]